MSHGDTQKPHDAATRELLQQVSNAVANVAEPMRYALLSSLFSSISDHPQVNGNGRRAESDALVIRLREELQACGRQKSDLEFDLKLARDELTAVQSARDAAVASNVTLKAAVDTLKKKNAELQALLTPIQGELESERDKRQRAEAELASARTTVERTVGSADTAPRLRELESKCKELSIEKQQALARAEELRKEKDARIEALAAQLEQARAATPPEELNPGPQLWADLAAGKRPYVDAARKPALVNYRNIASAFLLLGDYASTVELFVRQPIGEAASKDNTSENEFSAFVRQYKTPLHEELKKVLHGTQPLVLVKDRLQRMLAWGVAYAGATNQMLSSLDGLLVRHFESFRTDKNAKVSSISDYVRASGPEDFVEVIKKQRAVEMTTERPNILTRVKDEM